MPITCAFIKCKNRRLGKKATGISFHKFPIDEVRRKLWIEAIDREDFTPTVHSRICRVHFEEKYLVEKNGTIFLSLNAIPTIFNDQPQSKTKMDKRSETAEARQIGSASQMIPTSKDSTVQVRPNLSHLNLALLNVTSKKMSVLDAAEFYNVPLMALWDKLLNMKTEDNGIGANDVLTKEEEKKIARMMRKATDHGCQPRIEDLIYSVKSVLAEKGELGRLTNRPVNEWILGFLNRHPGMSLKPCQNLQKSIANAKGSVNTILGCSIKEEISDEQETNIQDALEKATYEVRSNGMNVFDAARLFKVSPAPLLEDFANYLPNAGTGRKLTKDDEAEIADIMREAMAKGIEVTRRDLRETVKGLLDSKGKTTKFVENRPSTTWVPLFLVRNPGITLKTDQKQPSRPSSGERSCQSPSSKCPSSSDNRSSLISKGKTVSAKSKTKTSASHSASEIDSPSVGQSQSLANSSPAVPSVSSANATCRSILSSSVSSLSACSTTLSHATNTDTNTVTSSTVNGGDFPSDVIPATLNTDTDTVTSLSSATDFNTNTVTSSSSISHCSASTTMSITAPLLAAPAISTGTSEKEKGFSSLLVDEVDTCQTNTTPSQASAPDKLGKTLTSDSTFLLIKRLTMMNFSFGEDRVLKFFSSLERGEQSTDVDYNYWKNLVMRIIPFARVAAGPIAAMPIAATPIPSLMRSQILPPPQFYPQNHSIIPPHPQLDSIRYPPHVQPHSRGYQPRRHNNFHERGGSHHKNRHQKPYGYKKPLDNERESHHENRKGAGESVESRMEVRNLWGKQKDDIENQTPFELHGKYLNSKKRKLRKRGREAECWSDDDDDDDEDKYSKSKKKAKVNTKEKEREVQGERKKRKKKYKADESIQEEKDVYEVKKVKEKKKKKFKADKNIQDIEEVYEEKKAKKKKKSKRNEYDDDNLAIVTKANQNMSPKGLGKKGKRPKKKQKTHLAKEKAAKQPVGREDENEHRYCKNKKNMKRREGNPVIRIEVDTQGARFMPNQRTVFDSSSDD